MSEQQKGEIRNFYTAGYNPEDIAEMFDLDEVEVMEYCTEISLGTQRIEKTK